MNAPAWAAWPVIALAAFGTATLTALAIAAVLTRKPPAPVTDPVPGAGTNPVPGQRPLAGAHGLPPRPAPAPAPPVPAHTAGPVSFIVYGWECGCELDFDGTGRVIWATGCGNGNARDRFDDFLKGLTDDQH